MRSNKPRVRKVRTRAPFLPAREKRLAKEYAQMAIRGLLRAPAYISGVTLTCAQFLPNTAGGRAWLTREVLSAEIKKFLDRLNRLVFKQGYRRYGKQLRRYSAIEGGDGSGIHLHAHLMIEQPDPKRISWFEFCKLLRRTWEQSEWAFPDTYVDPCAQEEATAFYLSKCGPDAIDLENCYFGP